MRFRVASQVPALGGLYPNRFLGLRGGVCAMALTSALLAGCAGGGSSDQNASLLPAVAPAIATPEQGFLTTARGKVIPVYSRIAAGLNACWLRPDRPLGRQYILNATVAPPPTHSAELVVHVRSKEGRHGLKAFTINLAAIGSTATRVRSLNVKLPEPQARRIAADIARWSSGERACEPEADWRPKADETATVAATEPEPIERLNRK